MRPSRLSCAAAIVVAVALWRGHDGTTEPSRSACTSRVSGFLTAIV